jgi:DNA polymerase-3 subunit beta
MDFTATKDSFLTAAQNVLRAVPAKSVRPELGGILFHSENNGIALSGTDSELGIKCWCQAHINSDGQVLLPGHYFVDVLRRLPPGQFCFRWEPSTEHVFISSGASNFELFTLMDEFPPLEQEGKDKVATIAELALRSGINQVSFAAARGGLRQLLNSVLLSLGKGKMRLVATDGHRLAIADAVELTEDVEADYLVPVRCMEEVARLFAGGELVDIIASPKQITFQGTNSRITSRLVEGKFLPYETIVPTEFSWRAMVDRAQLLSALERAQVFYSEKANSVNFTLTPDGIEIFAQSAEIGRLEDLVPGQIEGSELEMAFNVNYLIDPLRVLTTEKIMMEFSGVDSAALLSPQGSKNYRYLVMPITTRVSA